jgi:hypothetical protein
MSEHERKADWLEKLATTVAGLLLAGIVGFLAWDGVHDNTPAAITAVSAGIGEVRAESWYVPVTEGGWRVRARLAARPIAPRGCGGPSEGSGGSACEGDGERVCHSLTLGARPDIFFSLLARGGAAW